MRLRVVDPFAGAGLFSSGFAKEGCNIVEAIEIDKVAAETYARNIDTHITIGDIRHISPLSRKCEVLIAGPPCQGFSTLGKRNPNDERNRLSLEVVRWVRHTNPEVVVIENVTNFLKHPIWRELTENLNELGYELFAEVLNAYDFGVPQIRRRSFTIASKLGRPVFTNVTNRSIQTVREAWTGLPTIPDKNNHHWSPKPSKLALARMKAIPEGGDKRDVMKNAPGLVPPSWWLLGVQVTDSWGRMEWDKPSNTIRTAVQNASKGRYIHPEQNRVISLREAARLHSIDDSWIFEGLPTQIARQIGNSVPPLLARAVARGVQSLFGS